MTDDEYLAGLRWALLTTVHTVQAAERAALDAARRRASEYPRASSRDRAHRRWRARADTLRAAGLINDDGIDMLFPGLDPIVDGR